MGRPSKLTPAQWEVLQRRLLSGESARALGREFGISEAGVRRRFGSQCAVSSQSSQVRTAAEKLAAANTALAELPPLQRAVAVTLAEKLRNISASLASAAELGAATSHRLHALANSEVGKIDDANPMQSAAVLQGVAALTKMGNDAAVVPLNLLSANKEAVGKLGDDGGAKTVDAVSRAARVAQLMAEAERRKAGK